MTNQTETTNTFNANEETYNGLTILEYLNVIATDTDHEYIINIWDFENNTMIETTLIVNDETGNVDIPTSIINANNHKRMAQWLGSKNHQII